MAQFQAPSTNENLGDHISVAAMEPGQEDREDWAGWVPDREVVAAMEPGHEDREDRSHK